MSFHASIAVGKSCWACIFVPEVTKTICAKLVYNCCFVDLFAHRGNKNNSVILSFYYICPVDETITCIIQFLYVRIMFTVVLSQKHCFMLWIIIACELLISPDFSAHGMYVKLSRDVGIMRLCRCIILYTMCGDVPHNWTKCAQSSELHIICLIHKRNFAVPHDKLLSRMCTVRNNSTMHCSAV